MDVPHAGNYVANLRDSMRSLTPCNATERTILNPLQAAKSSLRLDYHRM
jgi:hypothetical protein